MQLASFTTVSSVRCDRAVVWRASLYSRNSIYHGHLPNTMFDFMSLRNSNYKNDFRYTVQIHKFILGLIGVWPVLEQSWHRKRLLKRLLNCVCYFLLSFSLIPWALCMFLIIDTFKARLKMCGAFCLYTMAPAVYCTLVYQEDRIKECLRHVEEDWRNVRDVNDRKIMLDKAKAGRFILITTTLFLFTCGFTYRLIQPIARGNIIVNENLTIRQLVQGNYYIFFDPQQSPAYEIVFSVQCMAGIVIYMITASVCGITALFTMHACGQLQMLISWLENLADDDEIWKNHVASRRLASIIMHHVRICKFLHRIQDIVGETCFIEIVGYTLILCLLGYYIITGWERNDAISMLTYTIMLISFTFNIFILCYIGEVLSSQGNKLSTTCCTVNWYCLPNKKARYFIFVIAMANCPMKIRANKFIDLSFSSFGAVIRTAMAYFNLLRTVTM
ncbi:odorant receptor 4-like [Harpegnathos saltator]|uniref:odorant receptor 4-like n=1 Tax=Harpegnathos saltator TaxID=610380 RepID=UPI00094914EB|nr:odorant receptor 4-like [Harpegnathos saltator]